jgi:hypothetical protein
MTITTPSPGSSDRFAGARVRVAGLVSVRLSGACLCACLSEASPRAWPEPVARATAKRSDAQTNPRGCLADKPGMIDFARCVRDSAANTARKIHRMRDLAR